MSEEKLTRRRSQPQESRFLAYWRNYRFELIWLAVVALGLFLVLEQMSIRANLARWSRLAIAGLFSGFQQFDQQLVAFLARFSLSDLVGVVLILGAAAAILLRIRWRLLKSPELTAVACPKCGGPIHRVHRKKLDHLISLYVPVRRYRCHDGACHWHGLRVGEHHGSAHHTAPSAG